MCAVACRLVNMHVVQVVSRATHRSSVLPLQACGLVKNLALMAYVTVGSPSRPVLEFLEEWTTEPLEEISPRCACLLELLPPRSWKCALCLTKDPLVFSSPIENQP